MGLTTPNIQIYIPAAGETNYDASFAAGMVNIDQHDHSGPPKGVPIGTSSINPGTITYSLLNSNVADTTTGIGTSLLLPNQLQLKGILPSIYNNATPTGLIAKNGIVASAVTITGTLGQVKVVSGDGSSGPPTISLELPDGPGFIVNDTGAYAARQIKGTPGQIKVTPEDGTADAVISLDNSATNFVELRDDFLSTVWDNVNAILYSDHPWSSDFFRIQGLDNHPGLIQNGAFGTYNVLASYDAAALQFFVSNGAASLQIVFGINSLSVPAKGYELRLGLGDEENGDQTNGCYIEYSDTINAGNWVYKTAAGGVLTTNNTAIPVTAAYHTLDISINDVGTAISYSLDGVSMGPAITTNIPALPLFIFLNATHSSGGNIAQGSILVDLIQYNKTLTNPRIP